MARHVGDLEETCLEKDYSVIFGKKCVGVLEETFGAFGENHSEILEVWRTLFGDIVVGNLEKSFSDFGENCLAILEIWRTLFGEIVVGDLEKSFGDFGENRLAILEIVMEYCNARRPYAEIES